ncbi:hypothetical protein RJ641_025940 [Dillenia turbinata]|uniref:Uncharacterized protein n=1 Tax=Dillenia turbinata TaxID=194707 RepID=A0AAN8ZS54_9MAGN
MSSEMESPLPRPTNVQRVKFIWRILLISNLGLGAYMFLRSRKKDKQLETAKTTKEVPTTEPAKTIVEVPPIPVEEEEPLFLPTIEPVKVQKEPIPWLDLGMMLPYHREVEAGKERLLEGAKRCVPE